MKYRTVRCVCGSIVAVLDDATLAPHARHKWTNQLCDQSGKSMNDLDFPVAGYVTVDEKNQCHWEDFPQQEPAKPWATHAST